MPSLGARAGVIVIMAGGAGARFWPLSSRTVPKQLLRIHQGRTLLELAFERAARLVPPERVMVVAGRHLRAAILETLPQLAPGNLIEEPEARNTAACLSLAAAVIEVRFGAATVMGVLTADHLIEDWTAFYQTVATAMARAESSDDLVTIGMAPTRPETAFGYMEMAEQLGEGGTGPELHRVRRFTEKPPLEQAKEFVSRGNYLWNSGMFFWKVSALRLAFERLEPRALGAWDALRREGEGVLRSDAFHDIFAALPPMPIDTAIMERAQNVVAVRGAFHWEDVGSWDALSRVNAGDAEGNRIFGDCLAFEAGENIVYNEGAGPGSVVLFGVDDLVVVRTARAVLIMSKAKSQELKSVVRALQEMDRSDLL